MSKPGWFQGTMAGCGVGAVLGASVGCVGITGTVLTWAGTDVDSEPSLIPLRMAGFAVSAFVLFLVYAAACSLLGAWFGSIWKRADVGVTAGGIVGLAATFFTPLSGTFMTDAAVFWTGGTFGGWFGAFERTRGPGRIRPRFRLLDAMIYVSIVALHLGLFVWLRPET